jgi:SAM-dependent methyltransferase
MARKGKASLEERGFGEKVVFAIAQGERSPLASNRADAAICRNVFHHLQRPEIILQEMARAVRPGGHVIIDDYYEPESEEDRAILHAIECLRVPSHVRTLSVGELRGIFEKAGLPIIHLSATFRRRTLSGWLEQSDASSENILRIRLRFEQMQAAGGGFWDVEKQGDDYLFSHKRMMIIGKKK